MGALWSLVLEGKVTSFLYYKFPWTILGICLSFWSELKNFDRNFGVGLPDYCRRHFDKRTFAQSPPGKAPETLESQNWCVIFFKVGRFHRNGATFWQSIFFLKTTIENEFESPLMDQDWGLCIPRYLLSHFNIILAQNKRGDCKSSFQLVKMWHQI